jgi:hypothetical protein
MGHILDQELGGKQNQPASFGLYSVKSLNLVAGNENQIARLIAIPTKINEVSTVTSFNQDNLVEASSIEALYIETNSSLSMALIEPFQRHYFEFNFDIAFLVELDFRNAVYFFRNLSQNPCKLS